MFVNNHMCVCVKLKKDQKSYTEQMKCLFTSIPFISSVDILITSQLQSSCLLLQLCNGTQ